MGCKPQTTLRGDLRLVMVSLLLAASYATTLEQNSNYQACIDSPATCTRLSLASSGFTSTLPTEVGLLTSLTVLDAYNNQVTGTLPTELGLLNSLTRLRVQINALTGTLPTELGLLTSIAYLYMYDNAVMGTLPTELGLLTSIRYLVAYDNAVTGTLPTELGLLTSLQQLGVCDNAGLDGCVPTGVSLYSDSYTCPSGATGGTFLGGSCTAGSEYKSAKEKGPRQQLDVFEDLILPQAVTTAFILLLVAIIVTFVALHRPKHDNRNSKWQLIWRWRMCCGLMMSMYLYIFELWQSAVRWYKWRVKYRPPKRVTVV